MDTTQQHITSDGRRPPSPAEDIEQAASFAELAAGAGLRGIEVAAASLLALLLCPPLFILVVIVAVPALLVFALVVIVGAVVAVPYELVRLSRGHQRSPHAQLLLHRLRHAAGTLADLLPHRIRAAARHG
jgi:Flp pilus assembly protein TadB